jgi:hypothetical protein
LPGLSYYRRIFSAYLFGGKSHLTFWHETPSENPNASPVELGEYCMLFAEKADYPGAYDPSGVPLLDYHGRIGLQYNPIAIAQYGLGNYNLFHHSGDLERRKKFFISADWLRAHLEPNSHGLAVWNHHFNWEYRDTLKAVLRPGARAGNFRAGASSQRIRRCALSGIRAACSRQLLPDDRFRRRRFYR